MTTFSLEIGKAERRIKAMEDKIAYYKNLREEAKKKRIEKSIITKKIKQEARKINPPTMIKKLVERKEQLKLFEDIGEQTTIAIDLLEGLTQNQKTAVDGLVKMGATPMGITVYTNTGDIYYFGKKVGNVK